MKRFALLFVVLLFPTSLFALKDTLSIPEIQGYGASSPYVDDTITTYGIVTGVIPDYPAGFFLQDANIDTFAGIFAFTAGTTPTVSRGDSVEVTGTVKEHYEMTELTYIDYNILGTVNIPDPLLLLTGNVGQEKHEGMLVEVNNAQCVDTLDSHGQWKVDDGSGIILIDDAIYLYHSQLNDYYNVKGPLHFTYDSFKIEPRDASDITNVSGIEMDDIDDISFELSYTGKKIRIQFSIPERTNIQISLYDLTGRLIRNLFSEVADPGTYDLEMKSGNVLPGLYFIHLKTRNKSKTVKLMVL